MARRRRSRRTRGLTADAPQGITALTINSVQAVQFYLRDSNGDDDGLPERKRGRRSNRRR